MRNEMAGEITWKGDDLGTESAVDQFWKQYAKVEGMYQEIHLAPI